VHRRSLFEGRDDGRHARQGALLLFASTAGSRHDGKLEGCDAAAAYKTFSRVQPMGRNQEIEAARGRLIGCIECGNRGGVCHSAEAFLWCSSCRAGLISCHL
jgi:hypothetical protein